MGRFERRLLYSSLTLMILALIIWMDGGRQLVIPTAHADPPLLYYGADRTTGMLLASGVSTNNSYPSNPWPQASGNYCFLADVQAIVRYAWWHRGFAINSTWPNRSDQGPPTYSAAHGNPQLAVAGQLLYDMDHYLVANFPPGPNYVPSVGDPNRRPFTKANSSHDFGGDPRAAAYTIWWETPSQEYYHNYIYHDGVSLATSGFAYALAAYSEPVMEFVDGAEHSVVVAGIWSYDNPITNFPAPVDSLAIYNSWDQSWGGYLNQAYYSRVSYTAWSMSTYNGSFWWAHGYDWDHQSGGYSNAANGGLDPDPYMGIYQAGTDPVTGTQTANPNSKHWVGNYVSIERDAHGDYNSNYTYNENDQPMSGP